MDREWKELVAPRNLIPFIYTFYTRLFEQFLNQPQEGESLKSAQGAVIHKACPTPLPGIYWVAVIGTALNHAIVITVPI